MSEEEGRMIWDVHDSIHASSLLVIIFGHTSAGMLVLCLQLWRVQPKEDFRVQVFEVAAAKAL